MVQFLVSPASSQCIVYPLKLDCTVNDMVDTKLGDVDDRSVEKAGALAIGLKWRGISPLVYVSVPITVIVSSVILQLRRIESLTLH